MSKFYCTEVTLYKGHFLIAQETLRVTAWNILVLRNRVKGKGMNLHALEQDSTDIIK